MPIEFSSTNNTLFITPSKRLDVFNAGQLATLLDLPQNTRITRVIVDLKQVETFESAPITVLSIAKQHLNQKGIELILHHVSQKHIDMMKQIRIAVPNKPHPPTKSLLETVGEHLLNAGNTSAEFVELMFDATYAFIRCYNPKKRPPQGSIIEQCIFCGVDALPIIVLLSALIGLILGFQAAYQLSQFGAHIYIADLVGISGVREFSPLMSAIIIAGRSGASIAAELGTMKVQEEIDALRSMGLSPIRFLVLPRLAALIITVPALSLLSCFIVIAGGMTTAKLMLDIQITAYLDRSIDVIKFSDWIFGISKSFVFAWIIGLIGCFSGMSIRGGASEVGTATTKSVVASIFLLIVIDSLFAMASTLLKM